MKLLIIGVLNMIFVNLIHCDNKNKNVERLDSTKPFIDSLMNEVLKLEYINVETSVFVLHMTQVRNKLMIKIGSESKYDLNFF